MMVDWRRGERYSKKHSKFWKTGLEENHVAYKKIRHQAKIVIAKTLKTKDRIRKINKKERKILKLIKLMNLIDDID